MAAGRIIQRETGATATLEGTGLPVVVSATGGRLDVVTRPAEPGFNPLGLLYASVATCLVLSVRNVAAQRGLSARLRHVEASVRGTKAPDPPSRVEHLHLAITIDGDLDEATKRALIDEAETVCTVSNTLRARPTISLD
ncbi:OsmC family protein [Alsobacter sp. R-9]